MTPEPSKSSVLLALATLLATVAGHAQRGFRLPFPLPAEAEASAADEAPRIEHWLAELGHPELGRREAAISALVRIGDPAVPQLRQACDARDPIVTLHARRAFGQIVGVSPETHTQVWEALRGDEPAPATAAAIRSLGRDAVHYAIRTLEDADDDDRHGAIRADLTVERSLHALVGGNDLGGRVSSAVLALGRDAVPALERSLGDVAHPGRLHALWLYATLDTGQRTRVLAPLLTDADPIVRDLALSIVTDDATEGDFGLLADAIGSRAGLARSAVATALAARVETENMARMANSKSRHGALALSVLGQQLSDTARDALVEVADRLDGDETDEAAAWGQALLGSLARHHHEDTTAALASAFAKAVTGALRASAISALRQRADDDGAMACLIAGLFDDDASVRMTAADALGSSGLKRATPALVIAARWAGDPALGRRALAAASSLEPDGPTRAGVNDQAVEAWGNWLRRQGSDLHREDLPWYRGSLEGSGVVEAVRERIHRDFFHFGKTELVDRDNLGTAAIESMRSLAESDALEAEGTEKSLIQRILANTDDAELALAALGTIPFTAETSDLVRLTDAAANGMMRTLGDRYSRVRPSNDPEGKIRPGWLPGLLDDADAVSNGFYAEEKDGVHRVGFVLFDSPAYYADVRVGDQLLKIGDDFVSDLDKSDLGKRLNTEDDFVFLREGWNRPFAKRLVPTKDNPDRLVTEALLPGSIGYVRLKQFEAGCSTKIEAAVKSLEKQGAVGFVLDLRNNPGGTVVDATNIVDLFLDEGKLICTNEYRDGVDDTRDEEVRATAKGEDRDAPLVVLVNGSSASASEMTSGSLQGNERALVIGQQSFGKGIGQNGITVDGFSSDTAIGRTSSVYLVYLTMMRYYLPEGRRSIHGVGVTPDIPVRVRSLRGAKWDRITRALRHSAFAKYVDDLLENHAELAMELAEFDGDDAARYPELEALHEKLARWIELDDTRELVRAEVRRRLLADADEDDFARILCDVQTDRTLQAAIREIAEQAEIDLTAIERYAPIAR